MNQDKYDSNNKKTISNINNDNQSTLNTSIALRVENLYKVYDSPAGKVFALRNINFSIDKGEFVSIVGPSGSGKSTLLNMIGALDRPSHGKVFIGGTDIFALNDNQISEIRNEKIGFIFQSFNLINRTTILKNVMIPSIVTGEEEKHIIPRALKLLEFLGLRNKAKFKPINLSGGQQQRVAIARSLMNNPTIILADEPTGALDAKTGNEVFNLLKLLASKYRRTIIMVTHNDELAAQTDRFIRISDGAVDKDFK
ncbi:MAG TPA: ABC transporter ATP-binding protein [Candidatus Nitrosocosmicus sp.]